MFYLKRKDMGFLSGVLLLGAMVFAVPDLMKIYTALNASHGLMVSFVKFAVLATAGEVLALRINCGIYYDAQFGLLSRIVVWGFLGIVLKLVFILFASGMQAVWRYLDLPVEMGFAQSGLTAARIAGAFSVSFALNMIFSPVLFVVHSITDEHIRRCRGHFRQFLGMIPVHDILKSLNWSVIWHFSIKKTVPFFWIPAHTIVFLLPSQHRLLAAAFLGLVLGVILAFARMEGSDFSRLALPVLEKMSRATHCMAFWGQIHKDHVYLAARHDYRKAELVSIGVGRQFPIHAGAHGKALAAFMPEDQREFFYAKWESENGGAGESVDREDLDAELNQCRAKGYACKRSRSWPEFRFICAPVFEKKSKALGVVMLLGAFDDSEVDRMGYHVRRGAIEMMGKIAA